MFDRNLGTNFEKLLARWIAACDQPFSAVEDPKFRKLLQYVHQQSLGILKIPNCKSVWEQIVEMRQDMIDGFEVMFEIGFSHI
jgi:hypothetical protein